MFKGLLSKIARYLYKHNIGYMVIGGQAVLLYGEPRLTKDIDITLAIDTDQLDKMLKLTKTLKLAVLDPDPQKFVAKTNVLPVVEKVSNIRVYFIFSSSQYERIAINRSVIVELANTSVNFASLEDLIIQKVIAGRPRDIEDIVSIILKNPGYDKKLIRKWLSLFDKSLDTSYLSAFNTIVRKKR